MSSSALVLRFQQANGLDRVYVAGSEGKTGMPDPSDEPVTVTERSLNATERRTLREMQERRDFILRGRARFVRLFRHPVDDDEQVKIPPPVVDVTDAPAAAWPAIVGTGKHGDGQLWVTNRRALVDNRGEVLREWAWDDLAEVRVIPGYGGVVLTPKAGDRVTVLRQVTKDTAVHSRFAPYYRWLTVEATFAAATGRLDGWYADLPGRMGHSR